MQFIPSRRTLMHLGVSWLLAAGVCAWFLAPRLVCAALAGALQLIAGLGGGKVESYPEDVAGRTVSASFLYNSRLAMFERQGFERVARLGQHHWVVSRTVDPR